MDEPSPSETTLSLYLDLAGLGDTGGETGGKTTAPPAAERNRTPARAPERPAAREPVLHPFQRFPALAELPGGEAAWTFEYCRGTDTLVCYLPLRRGMCTLYVFGDGSASVHASAGNRVATPSYGTVAEVVRQVRAALHTAAAEARAPRFRR